ncbi:MAG: hypothetical protein CMF22_10670 [Idiomarinaceae bacterium]|nr:hypothetical protein [Idiomarinaceae bacterium]MBG23904.1 hypothetical protein [Idiomarinaceae bacterium]|tara:strand:+ start:62375 stop:62587 length:213 start_codon:yes stop_codon:yes gene_type:complete
MNVWRNYEENSQIEPEIYLIVSKGKASLIELDRDYSVEDAYDLIEIIDIETDLESAAHKDAEQQNKLNGR